VDAYNMVVKRGVKNKIIDLAVSITLIILIISTLIPPATAVYLSPGTPNKTSVNRGTTITFENVNLTIRGAEKIPVNYLNFSIFNKNNNKHIAHIHFYINGTEIEDYPSGKFTVTNITVLQDEWYGYGYRWGYDEQSSTNHSFGYGYGYGYGNGSYSDITLLYTITYTTHTTGTFYAKLFVNSTTTHTYQSGRSTYFTVTKPSGGGTGGPSGGEEEEEEEEETAGGVEASEDTINNIEEQYDITLEEPFYANDTDGDGIVDTFTDPNNILTPISFVNISGNTSFLISTDNDEIPEFFWDTEEDSITPVTYTPGEITDTEIDTENETITITVNVNKTDWIYIEITDQYPDLNITIKTSDNRTIQPGMIWRKDGKIYVLDDPETQYIILYQYHILEPSFDPASGTIFYISKPTITITYQEYVNIISATLNNLDITTQITTTDHKTFTFTPTSNLTSGTYTLTIKAEDLDGNTLTSTATYIIQLPEKPPTAIEIPPWLITVIIVIVVIIIIIAVLFKTGYLYIE